MTLDSIIERLEKAESGDRELDLTIMNLLAPRAEDEKHLVMGKLLGAKWGAYGHMANQIEYFIEAPKVTSSVDAAIELAEKVLQGAYSMEISIDPSGCGTKIHHWPKGLSGAEERRSEGVATTMAVATVLAILKAKQMGVGE